MRRDEFADRGDEVRKVGAGCSARDLRDEGAGKVGPEVGGCLGVALVGEGEEGGLDRKKDLS